MPRKATTETAKATSGEVSHFAQVAVRQEMIQKAVSEINKIDQKIDKLKTQMAECREDKKSIFEGLSDNLGLHRKAVEWTIKSLLSPTMEVRDGTLDTIREVYETMRPGEQLDWLDATAKAEGDAGGGEVKAATAAAPETVQ